MTLISCAVNFIHYNAFGFEGSGLDLKHEFRNGISNIAGIILKINREQEAIISTQKDLLHLFTELRQQLLRILRVLEEADNKKELF